MGTSMETERQWTMPAQPVVRLRHAGRTDVGLKRGHNEDSLALRPEQQLFIVADGMGGHASGEVASRTAIDTMVAFFARAHTGETPWPGKLDAELSEGENRLAFSIMLANDAVRREAESTPQHRGMGTTIVAALIADEHLHVAHVGDSRAYRLRGGDLVQLTRDDSLLQAYIEAGGALTEGEQQAFPQRNIITRAVGLLPTVDVSVSRSELLVGDRILLCSDGLSGMVGDDVLRDRLAADKDLAEIVDELIDRANRAGGVDNITAVLVERVA